MPKQKTKPAPPRFSPQKYYPIVPMKKNGPVGSKRKARSPLPNRKPRPPPGSPPASVKRATARRLAMMASPVRPATLVQMMNFVKNSKSNALKMAQGLKNINNSKRNRNNAALEANIKRLEQNLRKMR